MSFCLSIFWAGPPCCQMLAPPLPRRYITILVLKFKNEVQSPKTVYVRELAITAKFQGLIQEHGNLHLYKRSPMFVIGNTIYQKGWPCQNHFIFILNERKWCIAMIPIILYLYHCKTSSSRRLHTLYVCYTMCIRTF